MYAQCCIKLTTRGTAEENWRASETSTVLRDCIERKKIKYQNKVLQRNNSILYITDSQFSWRILFSDFIFNPFSKNHSKLPVHNVNMFNNTAPYHFDQVFVER